MRDDRQSLADIVEATKLLGYSKQAEVARPLKRSPAAQCLAASIVCNWRSRNSDLATAEGQISTHPLAAICGFRNFIAHEYFSLELRYHLANCHCRRARA